MKKAKLGSTQLQGLNESVLHHILVGVLVVNKKNKILAANPAYCKIAGVERRKNIINTTIASQEMSANAPHFFQAIKNVLKAGKTEILRETPYKFDGQIRYLDARISPLKNNGGEIIGAIASIQDITETVELKTMIQYLRDYNDRIIDSSPAGILVTDTMGIITKVNKAHERISGRSKEEILGRMLYKNYAPNARQSVRDGFQDVVTSGKTRTFRYQMYPSSRKGIQYFHIRLGPLKDEHDQIIGVVQVIDDVTKEVKLQRELHQYAKHLEEKVKELNSSYVEVGKVNRQLASLIDIEKIIPSEKNIFSNIEQIIESVAVILGGDFAVLRVKEKKGYRFSLIHGKNKVVTCAEKKLPLLNNYFILVQKDKLPFQTHHLNKNEAATLDMKNLDHPIVSMSVLPLNPEQKDGSAILICFSKKTELTNLDIELGKAFIKRIAYLLGDQVQKPTIAFK